MPKTTSPDTSPGQTNDTSAPAQMVDLDDSMVKKIVAFNAGQRSETRAEHHLSIKDAIDSFYSAND